MVKVRHSSAGFGLLAFLLSGSISAVTASESTPAHLPDTHKGFLAAHCLRCHAGDSAEAGIRLDDLSFAIDTTAVAERWQKVLNVLNSGEMPPEQEPRPDALAKTELLAALSTSLTAARRHIADQGREAVPSRLNRREYRHTILALFDIDPDVSGLPNDATPGTFDTIGSGLFMSSDQFDLYLALGRRVATELIGRCTAPSAARSLIRRERVEPEVNARKTAAFALYTFYLEPYRRARAWKKAGSNPADAAAFGFKDPSELQLTIHEYELRAPYLAQYLSYPKSDQGAWLALGLVNQHDCESITIPPDAPPGRYTLRLRVGANDKVAASRKFMELGILDGRDGATAAGFEAISLHQITGTPSKPQVLEVPVTVSAAGPRTFTVREKRSAEYLSEAERFGREWYVNGIGPDFALWIDWTEWEGPLPDLGASEYCRRAFGTADISNDGIDPRSLLSFFFTRACRGAVPTAEVLDTLIAIYCAQREAGKSPADALVEPLAALLASPAFLYLADPAADAPVAPPDSVHQLSPLALASRLSYFLWSEPPDEELISLATSGRLAEPEELRLQTARMIADPRSLACAEGFTHQWLDVDRLDFFRFDYKLHPDFDDPTRATAKREIYHTFHHLLQRNRDARSLLKSDFVVVNALLATYYGIQDTSFQPPQPVVGDEFRPVQLSPDSPRGGLLGMAAVLAMGSNGAQTSPVERGAWVLRKLLHDPPPPAPPNVPQLSRLDGAAVTTRERLRMHQEEPQCAQCHRRIDPIGFGLENFDAAGRWRTVEAPVKDNPGKTFPIDPSGQLFGGPTFKNYFELRDRIAERSDDFLRGLTEHLFAYALGRPVSFADAAVIDGVVLATKADGGGLATLVQHLVASPEFRNH